MAGYVTSQQINTGNFIATTQVWDVQELFEIDVNSPEFKELLVRLYQYVNVIALATNNKTTGLYPLEEFVTSSQYFNPNSPATYAVDSINQRPEFRRTYNIGALPIGVTTTAHGLTITNTWQFVQIYGAASDNVGFNYYPIPYADPAGDIIINVDATNINITNNTAINFTSCIVVLVYLKY